MDDPNELEVYAGTTDPEQEDITDKWVPFEPDGTLYIKFRKKPHPSPSVSPSVSRSISSSVSASISPSSSASSSKSSSVSSSASRSVSASASSSISPSRSVSRSLSPSTSTSKSPSPSESKSISLSSSASPSISVSASPREYFYVDSSIGRDTNSGASPETPWQTVPKVNATYVPPNTSILLNRNMYHPGKLVPRFSGDAYYPIVFGDYGVGEKPIVDGMSDQALYISEANRPHYLRYENIDFYGATGSGKNVAYCASSWIYFYGCLFRGSKSGKGISMYQYDDPTQKDIHHNVIDNCLIKDNWGSGVYVGGTGPDGPHHIFVTRSTSHHNGLEGGSPQHHGFYVDYGVTVEYCLAYDHPTGDGIKIQEWMVPTNPDCFGIIRRNEVYNNYCGIRVNMWYAKIHDNFSHDNSMNLGFDVGGAHGEIIHNTFANTKLGTTNSCIFWNRPEVSVGFVVKNNLFIQDVSVHNRPIMIAGNGKKISDIALGNTFDYNTYYWNGSPTGHFMYDVVESYKDWNEWRALPGSPDVHGTYLSSRPDLVNRYSDVHPLNNGNLKWKAILIPEYAIDKDGNVRGDPATPGCYEEATA